MHIIIVIAAQVILRANVNGERPKYHYQGLMYPPTKEWAMFAPYREFVVNHSLCRAYDEPECTWWNALLIDSINKSVHNNSRYYYTGIQFSMPVNQEINTQYNTSEAVCALTCANVTTCGAFAYHRDWKACIMSNDFYVGPKVDYNRSHKIPRAQYYIKRERLTHAIASSEVERLLDYFDCRMNIFRCE